MSACSINKNIFFIVGCGRSGTTLLKTILNAHDNISITPETFFYDSIVKQGSKHHFDTKGKVNYLFDKWWIYDFDIEKDDVINNLDGISCQDEWDSVFLSLIKTYAEKEGVDYIGEKTPTHISRAKYFIDEFVGAKVICIFRDPRAVYNSYKKTKVGSVSVANIINEWKNAYYMHMKICSDDRYVYLKYEDLVNNSEDTIRKLTDFLGVDFDLSLLEFYQRKRTGYSPEQSHHNNTLKPIFNSSVDEWKSTLNSYQIALIESRLENEMNHLGYVCSEKSITYLNLYYTASLVFDVFHKIVIRKPRQLIKKYKAKRRHGKLNFKNVVNKLKL